MVVTMYLLPAENCRISFGRLLSVHFEVTLESDVNPLEPIDGAHTFLNLARGGAGSAQ